MNNKIGSLKDQLRRIASDYALKPSRTLLEKFRDTRIDLDLGVAQIGQAAFESKLAEFKTAAERLPEIVRQQAEISAELAKMDPELAAAQKRVEDIKAQAQRLIADRWGLSNEADRLRMQAQRQGAALDDPATWEPIAAAARIEAIEQCGADLEIKNILLV